MPGSTAMCHVLVATLSGYCHRNLVFRCWRTNMIYLLSLLVNTYKNAAAFMLHIRQCHNMFPQNSNTVHTTVKQVTALISLHQFNTKNMPTHYCNCLHAAAWGKLCMGCCSQSTAATPQACYEAQAHTAQSQQNPAVRNSTASTTHMNHAKLCIHAVYL